MSNDGGHRRAVIGNEKNFWLYSSETGFDLTHPPKPSSEQIKPNVRIETTTTPVTIDPAKSALVIIDMQNFFLSPAFGRADGAGHRATEQLVKHAIPAARKAGIRIIWLNWGLSEQEIDDMPPAVTRAFGFETSGENGFSDGHKFKVKGTGQPAGKNGTHGTQGVPQDGKKEIYTGLGSECGTVEDESGKSIDAGKLLTRGAWNSGLYGPLKSIYEDGAKLESRSDVWIHKNRMSGMPSPRRQRSLNFRVLTLSQACGALRQRVISFSKTKASRRYASLESIRTSESSSFPD